MIRKEKEEEGEKGKDHAKLIELRNEAQGREGPQHWSLVLGNNKKSSTSI